MIDGSFILRSQFCGESLVLSLLCRCDLRGKGFCLDDGLLIISTI